MPYGGASDGPLVAPVPWVAGWTYSPFRIRAFGRMKRMAWSMEPAATSSAVKSSGAIGKPAASALVHCSPRPLGGYTRVMSQTARQPPRKRPFRMLARHIS